MSRSAPPIIRLASFVAGEAAPKERVRVFSRAIQDSALALKRATVIAKLSYDGTFAARFNNSCSV